MCVFLPYSGTYESTYSHAERGSGDLEAHGTGTVIRDQSTADCVMYLYLSHCQLNLDLSPLSFLFLFILSFLLSLLSCPFLFSYSFYLSFHYILLLSFLLFSFLLFTFLFFSSSLLFSPHRATSHRIFSRVVSALETKATHLILSQVTV